MGVGFDILGNLKLVSSIFTGEGHETTCCGYSIDLPSAGKAGLFQQIEIFFGKNPNRIGLFVVLPTFAHLSMALIALRVAVM